MLIVGGGPAGLSAALRLTALQKASGGEPLAIAVLEKAREAGAHMLSGAVLDPSGLDELVPDWRDRGAPLDTPVRSDRVYLLTQNGKVRFPIIPPPLRNHGNYVISLNRFVRWLGDQVAAEGVDVFTGFAATDVLFDGDRVIGARTGDRGVDQHGARKPTFEPGVDIHATVTIVADGVRGNLTKTLNQTLCAGRGSAPARLFNRAQGAVGGSSRPPQTGQRDPHDGVPAQARGVRRRVHLRDVGRATGGRVRNRA